MWRKEVAAKQLEVTMHPMVSFMMRYNESQHVPHEIFSKDWHSKLQTEVAAPLQFSINGLYYLKKWHLEYEGCKSAQCG